MNNVGRVQEEEMGSGAGLLGKPQAPGVWKCMVTRGLRLCREERGPGPRGGQTQRDRGRGRPEKRGCSLRKGLPV